MSLFWQNLAKIILIASLVASCAGIPANKIKLSDYPDVDVKALKQIDLHYDYGETHAGLVNDPYEDYYKFFKKASSDKSYLMRSYEQFIMHNLGDNSPMIKADNISEIFNYRVVLNMKIKDSSISKSSNVNRNKGCIAKIITKKDLGFCPLTNFISPYTLTVIPYYCQHIYEAKASLISYPSPESIKGKSFNILANQSQAKAGDYFLDENSRLAHLLKTYELKDKVHEVWSSLMLLAAVPITPLRKLPSARAGKLITENNISEALTRSILNDASNFKECRK